MTKMRGEKKKKISDDTRPQINHKETKIQSSAIFVSKQAMFWFVLKCLISSVQYFGIDALFRICHFNLFSRKAS